MAKPKQISTLLIRYSGGSQALKFSSLDLKSGTRKYYLDVPSQSSNPSVYNGIVNAIDTLRNKTFIETILLNGDKLEFFLTIGSSSSIYPILQQIQDEINGEVKEWENKNLPLSSSTPPKMVYQFTEQDIYDLDEGDVIKYQRTDANGTIAQLNIVEVVEKGERFIVDVDVIENGVPEKQIGKVLKKDFLEKLIEANKIRDFIKAKNSSANPPATSSVSSMSDIRVETIINQTTWSQGLKDSMLEDFKRSGYFTFSDLVGGGVLVTAQRIEQKIDGFASGKNTYLQAKMLADLLFRYASNNGIPKAPSSASASAQPTSYAQPNTGDKIYGIFIKGSLSGELLEVQGLFTSSSDEKVIMYEVLLNGAKTTIPRDNFMVEGDIVEITFYGGSSIDRKILVLKNDTTIKVSKDGMDEENWNIGAFDWDEGKVKIKEYYNLHEIFESKQMAQSTPAQVAPKAIAKPMSDDEKEIDALKKSVSDLILLKNMFSPIEFEETIKIGQKIDEKQKKINELNLILVDKKLKGNKIFDDLFEQSFTPIQNNYNVYVESETENSDFFAPNGEKSMLKNSISSIIRTPLFKEWFGDWQLNYSYRGIENSGIDCSKVIGKNYEPLIVWHGTGAEFSYFRFDNFPAAYFAVNKSYSQWFARLQSGNQQGYTMPFFLNLKNPLDLTKFNTKEIEAKDFFDYMYLMTGMKPQELEVNPIFLDPQLPKVQTWVFLRNNPKMLKKLSESHVYDGIHFYETNPSVPEGQDAHVTEAYITFNPESCKIADPDRGDLILASMKSFLLEKGGKI